MNNEPSDQELYKKQIEAMQHIEVALRQILEPSAKERLSNIKIVNPEQYYKIAQLILQMYESGKINGRIDDETLKQVLYKVQPRKEINIIRK